MSCHLYGGGMCGPTASSTPGTTTTTTVAVPSGPQSGSLPFTGGDVAGIVLLGALFVAAGIALVKGGKGRRYHSR